MMPARDEKGIGLVHCSTFRTDFQDHCVTGNGLKGYLQVSEVQFDLLDLQA